MEQTRAKRAKKMRHWSEEANIDPDSKPTKKCRVCGEQALSFNLGGLSCESCKTFFRRCVFANLKKPVCTRENNCVINMKTRRSCSACRFQKCLDIGMKVEVLLSNKQKQKQRQDKVEQTLAIEAPAATPPAAVVELDIGGDDEPAPKPLSRYEQQCIEQVNAISARCFDNETEVPELGEFSNILEAFNITEIYVKKYAEFGKHFESFVSMPPTEQVAMLKRVFTNLFSMRKILIYDQKRKGTVYFNSEDCSSCLFLPFMCLVDMVPQVRLDQCVDYHEQLQAEFEDDRTLLNLSHASMFFHLTGSEARERHCEHLLYHHHFYRHLLARYLATKYRSRRRAHAKVVRLTKTLLRLFELVHKILKNILDNIDFSQMTHITVEIYNLL